MSEHSTQSEAAIKALALELGLDIDWDLIRPVLARDGSWDLERTIAENARTAELEFEWAITDQVNAGSEGYYPRGMGIAARMSYGAAMHSGAHDRMVQAEYKREAVKRLREVLAAIRGQHEE
jgi:hypothetical protein